MKRISELRYEMGFGGGRREHGRDGSMHRSHERNHRRGHGMKGCHSMSDEHFGRGGHGYHGGREHDGRGDHRGSGHGRSYGKGRFGGSRRISSEQLQLLVLALLADQTLHGYQIIKELETISQGFYKPSPGMIYPLLSFLEESDLASVKMDGTKKCYAMTDIGREYYAENTEQAMELLSWLKAQGELVTAMENAYEIERKSAGNPLKMRVQEIRTLLHHRPNVDEETQKQLAQILDETIAKIKAL